MKKKYNLYQVDSFTKELFKGNPASVVINADGLTSHMMQAIARELNNSETAFVFSSDSDKYDVYLRYFTPTKEVPICGHATIAAHYVRAYEKQLNSMRVIQKTGAGILPVDIVKENDDYKIIMTQGKVELGNYILGENREILLSALNITEDDLAENCPIQIVSTGHSKVMIAINNLELLNNLEPDLIKLANLSELIDCNGYYVFTLDSDEKDILVKGRMFAPAIGIVEDPVTGNANGPLGAYLVHHKVVDYTDETFKFKAKQGEAMNRTGTMEVHVKTYNKEPIEVKIIGDAMIVFKTSVYINI
ncbi:putative isomerase [Vallitalea longa]|uniref:Isomerase n=1 Tax=Vallitalea longa TaxID=2936439 RepID=A0A9W6DG87_9FIRM|nr:PhzF family isomerase [Vallitalea longa]GKX30287.1 putative isomerase [Vallitalea longa]